MRAKVEVDITKPLPIGCWVPRQDLPKIWIIYKYERLQDICFNCGILGHEQRTCKISKVMSSYCSSIPKYDQNLSTQPPKPLKTILYEHKKRYGDTTKDTASKTFKQKETAAPRYHSQQRSDSSNVNVKAKEKDISRKEWEEMIANCGEIFSKIVENQSNKPIFIRETSPRQSLSHIFSASGDISFDSSPEEVFPMPKEAFMSDTELEEYRKHQQVAIDSNSQNSTSNDDQTNPLITIPTYSESQDIPNTEAEVNLSENEVDVLMWREPPKFLSKSSQDYVVEFPPDDESIKETVQVLKCEEVNALALTIVTGMNIRNKRKFEEDDSNVSRNTSKQSKSMSGDEKDDSFGDEFGSFTIGSNSKKEATGKFLSPPGK